MNNNKTSIQERRKSTRWNLKVPLNLFAANSDALLGQVIDISLHGMKVASDRPFGEAEEMVFHLEIPDVNNQWRKTSVTALSVYCTEGTGSGIYYTGFKFLNIEPESLFCLQQLIDELSSFS